MADSRRLQLEPATPLQKDKINLELKPTTRLELELDCTSEFCNEYSYPQLILQAEEKERIDEDEVNLFGEDDDNDEKLLKIARKYEEKYNPKVGRKKRKKGTMLDDYVDRGIGYDETDPFIDNGEAYDELVPSTLTTEFGGFYINMGTLDFKNMSENENTDEMKMRKKRRKQKEEKELKKRRRIISEGEHIPKRRGRKPAITLISALPKMKKKTQPTVADMLQQHKAQLQQQQQEKLQQIHNIPISVERNVADTPEVKTETCQYLPVTVPVLNSTIWDAIESVVKASAEEATSNGSIATGSSEGDEVIKQGTDTVAPKLPENLPSDLDNLVKKLKEAAYNSEEGKCKFFSNDVNNMLLSVELKSQELTSTQRSTLYSHLASHLPCTKETLQKRAKKLRLDQEDHKLREPMQKLKDAITSVLPELLEKYEIALKSPPENKNEILEFDVPIFTDEETDDEDERDSNLPKKVFEWDDSTRGYLCDVVRIKLKCYEVTKTRIQSAEEYLKTFFRTEIKHLWPKGWMYARTLLKESREAHFHITNRPKKSILIPKKSVSPATVPLKSLVPVLNNVVMSQESNMEPVLQADRYVPSSPYDERKTDCSIISTVEDKKSDFMKLLTYPIKTPLFEGHLPSQVSPSNTEVQQNETVPQKTIIISPQSKTVPEQHIGTSQPQTKQTVISPGKTNEVNNYADSSLASDMLACIIRASLADFPYAGSANSDNVVKNKSVITTNLNVTQVKENRIANSKLHPDSFPSPKRSDDIKPTKIEVRKPSQDIASHILLSGGNMETLLNAHLANKHSDTPSNLVHKNKSIQLDASKSPVNLKLSSVIDSRQFADAFERSEHISPTRKPIVKHQITKISQLQSIPNSSAATSLVFTNANDILNESSISASSRTLIENLRISQDLAPKLNVCSSTQSASLPPLKKRSKYAQSSKTADQWHPYMDSGLSASLLEGMKGFPFPVSTLPPPPPAHCSAPIKTTVQVKDSPYSILSMQSPRPSSNMPNNMIRLESKGYSRASEPTNHSPQIHIRLPTGESQRRQSLIKGPWKSPQSSPTSHTQFLSANQSLINPKSTSPSVCSSTTHQNPTIVYAHSRTTSSPEKPAFSHAQSQLPGLGSHSPVKSISSRTSPSSVHIPHINQAFLVHQPSHSVSSHQPAAHSRSSTSFVHTHPSTTTSSLTGTYSFSQDQKTNPRPN